ncbi:auxin-responsive protein SAUR15-like [Impatiens glandulifera]|uniref:auxin-responsive protein SAUR15-like n=1 Tax=Impatiens glandulifera TaxID=253017 RepID=UPI001FB19AC0|nr:auxin-responsive protein SAUR15-like [Impatiens glandulifera]
MSGCRKILHIVKLRQMLRQWRQKAATATLNRLPSDVPAGHVAVCVGTTLRRFIIPTSYLNHPVFRTLLVLAEEEYGFTNSGPLMIPCEEELFEEILNQLNRSDSGSSRFGNLKFFQRKCHVGFLSNVDLWLESRALLHSCDDKSFW